MSRAEELFDAERKLRQAAVGYSNARSGAITDRKELEDLRRALRAAAIEYAETANDLDWLAEPKDKP
jgi:hypothetical protein